MYKEAEQYLRANGVRYPRERLVKKLLDAGYDSRVVKLAEASVYSTPLSTKQTIYRNGLVFLNLVLLAFIFFWSANNFSFNFGCQDIEQPIPIPSQLQSNYLKFEVPVYDISSNQGWCGPDFNKYPTVWTANTINAFGESPEQFAQANDGSATAVDTDNSFIVVRAFNLIDTQEYPADADHYTFLLLSDDSGNESLVEYGEFQLLNDYTQTSSAGIYNASGTRLGNVTLSDQLY